LVQEENAMKQVAKPLAFTCPRTGREFESGIHTDPESLARVSQIPIRLQCPVCGDTHSLLTKNGHFREEMAA
jgi:hypothetical protein